jgi:hypothetical protein
MDGYDSGRYIQVKGRVMIPVIRGILKQQTKRPGIVDRNFCFNHNAGLLI